MMHIAMHVKSMERLPTHDVIYSIVQWYLKERHDLSEVPFRPLVIVRLFPRRLFHGSTVVNGRWVPLDMTDSKGKERKRLWKFLWMTSQYVDPVLSIVLKI